jgi:two-component system, OmpR family, sensor kinase
MSLRSRLVLTAGYLLVVMAFTLAVPLAINIDRRVVSEFRSTVLGNAAILAARIANTVASAEPRGTVPLRMNRVVEETARSTGARVVVTDEQGRVLDDSARMASAGELYATPQRPEFSVALFEGRIDSRERFSDTVGDELALVTVPVVARGRVVGAVRLSQALGVVRQRVVRSWLGLGALAAAIVAVGTALAWLLAGSLVRPMRRLEEAAARLGQGDLSARANPEGPREVALLARSFNRMADVLSANLEAQRDFLANASHQLRTPLTGLRLRLEAIQEGEHGPSRAQAAKADRELDRLSGLVDDLLELAQASSHEGAGTVVDLADSARLAVERWSAPAAEKDQRVELTARGSVAAWADPADVAHVLDNLIENAIRYSPHGAGITVTAEGRAGSALLSVRDTGPGIPPEDRERVFQRFYRGSTGRQSGPGTGLGLPIVAELVGRWGGTTRLVDGPGTAVEVSFPSTVS